MSPKTLELYRSLEYELGLHPPASDTASRLKWALSELTRLGEHQERTLLALRANLPRLQHDYFDLSLRAAGTRLESDPLFQTLKLQVEEVTQLYRELEKEYAWTKS